MKDTNSGAFYDRPYSTTTNKEIGKNLLHEGLELVHGGMLN